MSKEQYIEFPEEYTRRELNARYREIPLKDTTSRLLRKYFNAMANLYGIIPLHRSSPLPVFCEKTECYYSSRVIRSSLSSSRLRARVSSSLSVTVPYGLCRLQIDNLFSLSLTPIIQGKTRISGRYTGLFLWPALQDSNL